MNACPLCGCTDQATGPGDGFVVCGGCAEILRPTELVRRGTRRTRRRYLAAQRGEGS
jgi:hypothetical protein